MYAFSSFSQFFFFCLLVLCSLKDLHGTYDAESGYVIFLSKKKEEEKEKDEGQEKDRYQAYLEKFYPLLAGAVDISTHEDECRSLLGVFYNLSPQ